MADHQAQRIGVRWVIKQLPFSLMVALVTFGAVGTFEPIRSEERRVGKEC